MNDVKNMLERAIPSHLTAVDPAADIARGRNALRKRRMTRLGAGASGLAVVAAVSGVLISGGTGTTEPQTPAAASTTTAAPTPGKARPEAATPSIALVAYTGEQVPGYRVGFVPKGWEIQGGNNSALVIAKKGFKNQDINSYESKIAVMLQSADAGNEPPTPITQEDIESWGMEGEMTPTTVEEVSVSSRQGWITRPTGKEKSATVVVSFADAKDNQVIVQGPVALGWDDAQWVKFAESAKVLTNAEPGVG